MTAPTGRWFHKGEPFDFWDLGESGQITDHGTYVNICCSPGSPYPADHMFVQKSDVPSLIAALEAIQTRWSQQ